MNNKQKELIESLVKEGLKRLNSPKTILHFGTIPESETLLNDIVKYPHFYVLGCVMDRQIKAEKAWTIPYKIGQIIKSFEFKDYLKLSEEEYIKIFEENRFHRFNKTMGICFYLAIQKIHLEYNDDASNIWKNTPKSSDVLNRFYDFKGVGDKIANMAVNILIRDFKIPMSDYSAIDLPPDSQVKKFLVKNGFVNENASPKEIILLARQLYPKYPGILDIAWEEGRKIKNFKHE